MKNKMLLFGLFGLFCASTFNHISSMGPVEDYAIRLLTENAAQINITDKFNDSLLDDVNFTQLELKHLIELIKNNDFKNFKLHFESYQIDIDTKLDLQLGDNSEDEQKETSELFSKNDDGKTLLIFAIEKCNLQLMEYLISNGADVNVIVKDEITPLNTAVFNNNIEAAQLLISKGVDININPDKENEFEYEDILVGYFSRGNINPEMVRLLIKNGYNLHNAVEEEYFHNILEYVLHNLDYNKAIEKEIIELLFNSIDKIDSKRNFINFALLKGNTNAIIYLLEKGTININYIDSFGNHMLYTAAFYGSINLVKFLIKMKVNINRRSKGYNMDRQTPLMAACQEGHATVVMELLKAGANTTIKNKDKKTAYDLALEADKKNIVEILDNWNLTMTTKIMESVPAFSADIAKLTVDILNGSNMASKEHQVPDQEVTEDASKKPLEAEVKKKKRRRDSADEGNALNPEDPNFNLL